MARKNKSLTPVDISHLFQVRSAPEQFSVWYDPVTGKITGVAPHTNTDQGSFIVGTGDLYLSMLNGERAIKEYLVGYDPAQGRTRVMHLTEWAGLLGEKHEIQLIDFETEQDITKQFSLSFYKAQRKCELVVNHDAFINMFHLGNEDQIAYSQRQKIRFFVRDKNTGYLVARHDFEFDISNDNIMEADAPWLEELSPDDIEVMSHKNFCTYTWSWRENQIERTVRVNRTRVIPASRSNDFAHLNFRIHSNGTLLCESHIVNPINYNIHQAVKVWITKRDHPDALVGSVSIPVNMIQGRKTLEIDRRHLRGFRINDLDFLTDNQYIKIFVKDLA